MNKDESVKRHSAYNVFRASCFFCLLLLTVSGCGGGGGSTSSTPTGTVTGTVSLPANTNAKLFEASKPFYARLLSAPAHAAVITDLTTLTIKIGSATTNPDTNGSYTLTLAEGTNLELTVTAPSGNVVLQAIIPSVTAGSATSQTVDSTSTAVALLWKSNTNLSLAQIQTLPAFTNVKNAVESALTDVVVDSISANTSVTSAVQTAVTPALTSITLSPSSVTLISGASQTFTATGLDQYGNILSFTPTLAVTPSGLGSISSSGVFTAVKTGTGTITVTGGNNVSASASITVTTGALNSLVISPTSVTLYKNDTQQFTVYGVDASGNAKERKFITVSPAWSVTGSVGTLDTSGLFTASAQGTGQVKAETLKSDGTAISIASDVTVSNRSPVISSGPTASTSSISAGSTTTISVTASDADNDSLTYTFSATGGTLSPSTVTGSGTATVTYTAPSTGGTYTITVTVTDGKGGSASGNTTVTVKSVAKQVSAGINHTCVLDTSGTVRCSGVKLAGSSIYDTTPQVVSLSSEVSTIAAGGYHTCALTTSGGIKCWGENSDGQLGNGNKNDSFAPVDGPSLSVTSIVAGGYHTCALTTSGGVKCWGYNSEGELGDGTYVDSTVPVDVTGLSSGASAVTGGGLHTCALTTSGGVKCWGNNGFGELGNGSTTVGGSIPVDVTGLSSGVTVVSAGEHYTCALTTSGGVKCWGKNGNGQLGNGTDSGPQICGSRSQAPCSTTPVDVTGLSSGVSAIEAGVYHTCALTTSGGVKCWGYNGNGQLGNGTTTSSNTPVDVTGLSSGVTAVSAGGNHTCALLTSGGVKCWGSNYYGQLGNGTSTNSATPISVIGFAD